MKYCYDTKLHIQELRSVCLSICLQSVEAA